MNLPPARAQVHEQRLESLFKEAFLNRFGELEKQARQFTPEELDMLARQTVEHQRETPPTFDPMGAIAGTVVGAPVGVASGLYAREQFPDAPPWAQALAFGGPATLAGLAGGFLPGLLAGKDSSKYKTRLAGSQL